MHPTRTFGCCGYRAPSVPARERLDVRTKQFPELCLNQAHRLAKLRTLFLPVRDELQTALRYFLRGVTGACRNQNVERKTLEIKHYGLDLLCKDFAEVEFVPPKEIKEFSIRRLGLLRAPFDQGPAGFFASYVQPVHPVVRIFKQVIHLRQQTDSFFMKLCE